MLTLDEVKANKPKMIFYSANTVWWTDDPKDLRTGPVPVDIFGSPLFQTAHIDDVLNEKAISQCETYGKNPVRNFMLAHAKNIHLVCGKMPPRSFDLVTRDSFYKWCDENFDAEGKELGE